MSAIGDKIRRIHWAFDRTDSRKEDVLALAAEAEEEIAAAERRGAERERAELLAKFRRIARQARAGAGRAEDSALYRWALALDNEVDAIARGEHRREGEG